MEVRKKIKDIVERLSKVRKGFQVGIVVHTYNPSYLEDRDGKGRHLGKKTRCYGEVQE
jgi:hypothetical protein